MLMSLQDITLLLYPVMSKCRYPDIVCRLDQGKLSLSSASPPLPNYRVSFNRPYEVTGID